MLKRLLLLLVMSLLTLTGCDAARIHKTQVPQAALAIHLTNEKGDEANCSATAVGTFAVLTAAHCFSSNSPTVLYINGIRAFITGYVYDGHDHIVIYINNIAFSHPARIHQNYTTLGEELVIYGNPEGLGLTLRKGIVSKIYHTDEPICKAGCTEYEIPIAPGDSGAGIFRNGELVGMVTGVEMYPGRTAYMPMYSLRMWFTPEQLKEIVNYGR